MNDRDVIYEAGIAAVDRITRYRRLRMAVVVVAVVLALVVGVDTWRIVQLNSDLCVRVAANRTAARDLATATLISTPIPANVDAATRAQILSTRADRQRQVDLFLARYPRVNC